jgi:hypothetical protein
MTCLPIKVSVALNLLYQFKRQLTPSLRSFTKSTTATSLGSIFVFSLYTHISQPLSIPLSSLSDVPFRKRLLLYRNPFLLLGKRHLRQNLFMRRFNCLLRW